MKWNIFKKKDREEIYFFTEVIESYYSVRNKDVTDNRFTGLFGTLTISISRNTLTIHPVRDNKCNAAQSQFVPLVFRIKDTDSYTDSKNNPVTDYHCYAPNNSLVCITLCKYFARVRENDWEISFSFTLSRSRKGSAIAINSNTLVTSLSLIDSRCILTLDGDILELIYRDYELDLAILKSSIELKSCTIDRNIYVPDTEVAICGFPQINEQKVTKCFIFQNKENEDIKRYKINTPFQFGNVGGGVIKEGKIIGLILPSKKEDSDKTYALKSNFLGAVLDSLNISNTGKFAPKECIYPFVTIDFADLARNKFLSQVQATKEQQNL